MFLCKTSNADKVCYNPSWGLLMFIGLLFCLHLSSGKSMDEGYLDLTGLEKGHAHVAPGPLTSSDLPWLPFLWEMNAGENDLNQGSFAALPEMVSHKHESAAPGPMQRRAVMTSYLLGRNSKRGSFWTGR